MGDLDDDELLNFSNDIKEFTKIEKLIFKLKKELKPLQDQLKILNKNKKDLEHEICIVMGASNCEQAQTPDGHLEYIVKKAVIPINKQTSKDKMILFFESGPGSQISFHSKSYIDKGNCIYEYIYGKDNRDYVNKEKLKSLIEK